MMMRREKKSLIPQKILNHNFPILHWLGICFVILPAVVMGILILTYSVNIPYWDQWNLMPQLFIKISQNSLSWQDLIAQHNESRKLFPRLIFLALAYLTNWDVRYEMLAIFFSACLVSLNIYRLNRLTVKFNIFPTLLIAFLANILIFSAIQYDNWFWGIQLVVFMPIACITTAISVIYSRLNLRYKFLICMMLCIISTFSYSNGMIAWVIILPVLILVPTKSRSDLLKQKWLFLSWIAVFITNIIIYFYDYRKPEVSPSIIPAFQNPEKTLQFFLAFLGYPLGSGYQISPLIYSTFMGGVEIAIFFCLCLYLIKHIQDNSLLERTIGWITLGFYSIVSALITSVGRVELGIETALSSKYTTFSIYLIVAIIHLLPIVVSHIYNQTYLQKSQVWLQKITVVFAILGLLVLYGQSFTYSVKEIQSIYQLRMDGKTCLSFINLMENKYCVAEKILNNYDDIKYLANQLNNLGMLKPGLVIGDNIEAIASANSKSIATKKQKGKRYGSLDAIMPLNNWYFVNGWAFLPERNEPADAIILTYKNQADDWIIFDILMSAQTPRKSLVQLFNNPAYFNAGWEETIAGKLLPKGKWKISAWAFDAKFGKAYKLDRNHVISKN